jgi:hypothetical protein
MLVGLLVISGGAAQLSVETKPLPEIETVPAGLMKVGLSVILGAALVTVNVAEAKSKAVLPVAVTV